MNRFANWVIEHGDGTLEVLCDDHASEVLSHDPDAMRAGQDDKSECKACAETWEAMNRPYDATHQS